MSAFLSLIAGIAVSGEPPWLELDWQGPEACPSAQEVTALVEAYGREEAGVRVEAGVRAHAVLAREETERWSMTLALETRSGRSSSQIEGESCVALARAAALKIAVARELERSLELDVPPEKPTAPEPAPPPAPEPEPEPVVTAERESPPVAEPELEPPPPPAPVTGALRMEGGASAGALPAVGGGVALAGAVVFRRARLELVTSYWPLRKVRLGNNRSAGADMSMFAGGVRGCPELRVGRVEFPACAGVEAGFMRGVGVGLETPETSYRPWLSAVFGVGLAVRLHARVRLGLEVQSGVALLRPAFHIEGEGRVHHAGPATIRGLGGIEVALGRVRPGKPGS